MIVFGSVAYHEIINIQGAVYSRVKAFDDAVNFYTKEDYYKDAWFSNMNFKVSI